MKKQKTPQQIRDEAMAELAKVTDFMRQRDPERLAAVEQSVRNNMAHAIQAGMFGGKAARKAVH